MLRLAIGPGLVQFLALLFAAQDTPLEWLGGMLLMGAFFYYFIWAAEQR